MFLQVLIFASLAWGPYTVSWQKLEPGELPKEDLFMTIRKGTRPLKTIPITEAAAETLDVDNDGISELFITDYSGGAHCCFTYFLYTRKPDLRLMGAFDMGNGGLKFEDLDGDGSLEAVGSYDGFAYFDFCYAASPFLPIVFSLKNGRYVEDTKAFPELLKNALKERLESSPAPDDEDNQKAHALALFALGLLAADDTAAWRLVRSNTPATVPWLKETEGDIKRILEDRKSRVKYSE